jgi:hypothetical protein
MDVKTIVVFLGSLGKAFSSGDLKVPSVRNIPGTSISIPLYFGEDEAFPPEAQLDETHSDERTGFRENRIQRALFVN